MNKIFAVKQNEQWWSVIDCGTPREGGMSTGTPLRNPYFKKDGKLYKFNARLFLFPDENLTEWEEIKIATREVDVLVKDKELVFEGWDNDKHDGMFHLLQDFAKMIGKDLSIEQIKELLNNV